MAIFSNLFGGSNKQNETNTSVNWIELLSIDQLNEISEVSLQKPVIIFKHSTRCIVSRTALKQFENEFSLGDKSVTYFLDLLEHRDISNEITSRFGIYHESPQLLLIKNGKVTYHASHSEIDAIALIDKV